MTIAVFISGDDSKEYPLYEEVTGIEQSPQQDTGTSSTDENGGCDDDDECDEQVQYFKIAKKTNELVVIALRRVNSQNVAYVDALRNAIIGGNDSGEQMKCFFDHVRKMINEAGCKRDCIDECFVFCHWGTGGTGDVVSTFDAEFQNRFSQWNETEAGKDFAKWRVNAISSMRNEIFDVTSYNPVNAEFGIGKLPKTSGEVKTLAKSLEQTTEEDNCKYDGAAEQLREKIDFVSKVPLLFVPCGMMRQAIKLTDVLSTCCSGIELKNANQQAKFYPIFVNFQRNHETQREISGCVVPEEFILRFVKDEKRSDIDLTIELIKRLQARIAVWASDSSPQEGLTFADMRDWMAGAFRRFCALDEEVHGTGDRIDVVGLEKFAVSSPQDSNKDLEKTAADWANKRSELSTSISEYKSEESPNHSFWDLWHKVYENEITALEACTTKGDARESATKFLNEVVYTPHGSQIKYFSPVGKLSCLLIDDEAAVARGKIEAIKLDERLSEGKYLADLIDIKDVAVDARSAQTVIQQAIIEFKKIQNSYATYDFVLLDLRLADKAGDDPSGYQLIKVIRQFFPQVPIVIYSRYDDMGHISRAFKMGADWFIRKDEIQKLPRHLFSIFSLRNWRKEWNTVNRLGLCGKIDVRGPKDFTEEQKYLTYRCMEKLPGKDIFVKVMGDGFSSAVTFRAHKGAEIRGEHLQDPVIIKIDTAFNTMTEYERYFRFIRPYIANESGRVESKEITLDHNNSAITYTFAGKNDSSRVLDTMKNMLAEDVRYMARCDYKKYEAVFDEIFDDILPKIHRVSPELESEVSSYPNRIFGEKEPKGTGFIDNYLARIPLSRHFEVKAFGDEKTPDVKPFEVHGVKTEGDQKVIETYASKMNIVLNGDLADYVARYRELKQGQTLWVLIDEQKKNGDNKEKNENDIEIDAIVLQSIHEILDPNCQGQPKCFDGKKDYVFKGINRDQEAKDCFISICRNLGVVDDSITFDKNDMHAGIVRELYTRTRNLVSDDKEGKIFWCRVGIVHGDLNYANIMVDSKKDGTIEDAKDVWLIDFARTRRDIIAHDFNVIFTATFSQLFNNDLWNDKGVGGDERYAARITRIFKTFINDAMFAREDEVPDYIAGDRRFTLFYKIFRRIRKAALDNMTEDMYTLTTALCCLYTFKVFLKYEKNIQGAAALLATAYICIKHLEEAKKDRNHNA